LFFFLFLLFLLFSAEGNEEKTADKRKVKPLKTYPTWTAANCSHLTVGNMKGHEKKISKMDEAVLQLLAVRMMFSFFAEFLSILLIFPIFSHVL
jgi:hypothetical protein